MKKLYMIIAGINKKNIARGNPIPITSITKSILLLNEDLKEDTKSTSSFRCFLSRKVLTEHIAIVVMIPPTGPPIKAWKINRRKFKNRYCNKRKNSDLIKPERSVLYRNLSLIALPSSFMYNSNSVNNKIFKKIARTPKIAKGSIK